MDFTKLMLKEFSGNITIKFAPEKALKYYKWVSYIPSLEQEKIEPLLGKHIKDLTQQFEEKYFNFLLYFTKKINHLING